MRKVTYLAAAVLMGVTIAATPVQAKAAGPLRVQCTVNSLKDFLESCKWGNVQIITIPCLPGNQPEVDGPTVEAPNQPGQPDVEDNNQTNQPEIEDDNQSNQPEQPDVEDNNQSGQPDVEDSEQSVHAYVQRIVELVNEERAKAGLNALTLKEDITEAAQVRAVECETLFSHTRPNGTSFVTALKEAGVSYRGAGENIAWGQKTPEQVMEGWMNSAGHRANILNEKYTSIGVGYYQNASGVNYWSQLFTY